MKTFKHKFVEYIPEVIEEGISEHADPLGIFLRHCN